MKNIKEKVFSGKLAVLLAVFAAVLSLSVQTNASAAGYSASAKADRANGTCSYTVSGIDMEATPSMTLNVSYTGKDGQSVVNYTKEITFDSSNCADGEYKGSFAMTDMESYVYANYKLSFTMSDGTEVKVGSTCDFSVHTKKYSIVAKGGANNANRNIGIISKESSSDVIVPGKGNEVKLVIWKKGSDESSSTACGIQRTISNKSVTWDLAINNIVRSYGKYYAKVILVNSNLENNGYDMGKTSFDVDATCSKVAAVKTSSLEKKNSFKVTASTVKSALGVQNVYFDIYNSAGKRVFSKKGSHKSGSTFYQTEINLKSLNYKLDKYTVKVHIKDNLGNTKSISGKAVADERAKGGSTTVKKNKKAFNCKFILKNAYIPGGIKEVRFNVYIIKNGKQQYVKKYYAVKGKSTFYATMPCTQKGKYVVYSYGVTQWGKKVLLSSKNFKLVKSDIGKNGWYYEKYAGKKYKMYYKNNVLVKDLTKILGIKKNATNLYIELNRAACVVNVYAYDPDTKKYIIPVKTFTVSVGRDVSSTGSASSLSLSSSNTPIGTYSICSNGTASKYTVKPMHEPDGSTVYARWASHVVGNVYFHSIAVGSDSHYALNPYTYNRLGSPASAGCIRMAVADAKWLYDYAAVGTTVKIVVGNASKPGPFGKSRTIKVSSSIHYDPTDPAVPLATKKRDYKAGRISGYMTKSGKKVGY